MKIIIITLLLIISPGFKTLSQNHIVVSGSIENAETRDFVPLVHVYITQQMIGSISNTIGDFILRLPLSGKYDTLVFSHIGFETERYVIDFSRDTQINVSLMPIPIVLPEFIVFNMTVSALFDSILTRLNDNYSSTPILLDAFIRIRGVYESKPQSFKTGSTVGEFALKIYKNPYADLHNNSNSCKDQVKYIEWQKSDTLLIGEDNTIFYLYPHFLPTSDVLCNINKSFIYSKRWLKKNDIYIEGIQTYQHGEAYRVIYKQKENEKGKPFEGIFLIDTKSFAIVSYERYLRPEGMEYEELKTGILKMPFNMFEEAFYIRYDYEKIDHKWYLKSIFRISKETIQYINKGIMGDVYFNGENESLDHASVEGYKEATLIVTKLSTNNIKEFDKDELIRLEDIKPFVSTNNNVEFHQKYNAINNSDLWIDRIISKKLEKLEKEIQEVEDEEQ